MFDVSYCSASRSSKSASVQRKLADFCSKQQIKKQMSQRSSRKNAGEDGESGRM